jgi:hypothetical protein
MADKQACPNCRHAANEGHLRVNPGMEDVVSAWKTARFVIRLFFVLDSAPNMILQTIRSTAIERRGIPSQARLTTKSEEETKVYFEA